uniref:Uncharacterized protein n=1 Tax=Cyprinus carpio carpio TaxID=630221 RepID=A0A9J8CI69_CYPCA
TGSRGEEDLRSSRGRAPLSPGEGRGGRGRGGRDGEATRGGLHLGGRRRGGEPPYGAPAATLRQAWAPGLSGYPSGPASPRPPPERGRGAPKERLGLDPSFSRSAFALVSVCYDRFLSRGGEAAPEPRPPDSRVSERASRLCRANHNDPSAGSPTETLASRLCRANHNDPSAGSPTETLLRLLLPPDSQV